MSTVLQIILLFISMLVPIALLPIAAGTSTATVHQRAGLTRVLSGACTGSLSLEAAAGDMRLLQRDSDDTSARGREWRTKVTVGAPIGLEFGFYFSFESSNLPVSTGESLRCFVNDTPWVVIDVLQDADIDSIFVGNMPTKDDLQFRILHFDSDNELLWSFHEIVNLAAFAAHTDMCANHVLYTMADLKAHIGDKTETTTPTTTDDDTPETDAAPSASPVAVGCDQRSDAFFQNIDTWHPEIQLEDLLMRAHCDYTGVGGTHPHLPYDETLWSGLRFGQTVEFNAMSDKPSDQLALTVELGAAMSHRYMTENLTLLLFSGQLGLPVPVNVSVDLTGRSVTGKAWMEAVLMNKHLGLEAKHLFKNQIPIVVVLINPRAGVETDSNAQVDKGVDSGSVDVAIDVVHDTLMKPRDAPLLSDRVGMQWDHLSVLLAADKGTASQVLGPTCDGFDVAFQGCAAGLGLQVGTSSDATVGRLFTIALKPSDRRLQTENISVFASRELYHVRVDGPYRDIIELRWNERSRDLRGSFTFQLDGQYSLQVIMPVPRIARSEGTTIPGHLYSIRKPEYEALFCPDPIFVVDVDVQQPICMRGIKGRPSIAGVPTPPGYWHRTTASQQMDGSTLPGAVTFPSSLPHPGWVWQSNDCVFRTMRDAALQQCVTDNDWNEIIWLGDSRERAQFEVGTEDLGAATWEETRAIVDGVEHVDNVTGYGHMHEVRRLDRDGFPTLASLYLRSWMQYSEVDYDDEQWLNLSTRTATVFHEQRLCMEPAVGDKAFANSKGLLFVTVPLWEIRSLSLWSQNSISDYLKQLRELCPGHTIVFLSMPPLRDHRLTAQCRLGRNCEVSNTWVKFQNSVTVDAANEIALAQAATVSGVIALDLRRIVASMWETDARHDDGVHLWKGPGGEGYARDTRPSFVVHVMQQVIWNAICD